MKRIPFVSSLAGIAAVGAVTAAVACGGISDPTRGSDLVASVSGALTGMDVPANTRVALVWKVGTTGSFAVGYDVAVVNGRFTMDLAAPPSSYFFAPSTNYESLSGGGAAVSTPMEDVAPPAADESPAGGSSGIGNSSGSSGNDRSAFAIPNTLSPRDTVSGQITQPLTAAVAGFVVYVDTNGNGKLDIEGPYATPTDEVIGGNKELLLTYLRDGGALDYEKLRDRAGLLPKAGYNLAWDQGRWLPLDVVELKLTSSARLPNAVCGGAPVEATPPQPSSGSSGSTAGRFPDRNDPNLECAPDGRSFRYTPACNDPLPQSGGLCASSLDGDSGPCIGYGTELSDGLPIPEGWPCVIADQDGGAAPDAGN